jgi:hypothetical protein
MSDIAGRAAGGGAGNPTALSLAPGRSAGFRAAFDRGRRAPPLLFLWRGVTAVR